MNTLAVLSVLVWWHLLAVGSGKEVICGDGDIRLVEGESELEGRLELCLNEEWNTVCDQGAVGSERVASVACGQLGYSRINVNHSRIGGNTGPVVSINCAARPEFGLIRCRLRIPSPCSHTQDLGIHCNPRICEDGDIRLVQGQSELEGYVEVCQNEVWGTVCDDHWSTNDATVACQQLGFSPINATATLGGSFGIRTGMIHVNDMLCTGSESRLIDCPHSTTVSGCDHSNDAGVVCREAVLAPRSSTEMPSSSEKPSSSENPTSSEKSKANCNAVGGGLGAAIALLMILLLVLIAVLVYLVFKLRAKNHKAAKEAPPSFREVKKNQYGQHQQVYAIPSTGLGPQPSATPVHIYNVLEPPVYDNVQ